MPIDVEANMKIPRLTIRSANQPDKVIDNSTVRFIKRIQVPAIPKPGASLTLTTSGGQTFESTVTRADWHEEKSIFIVSCNYAKRSISADDYHALVNDPDWTMKPLI
ncbi:MAG: hypothetical protein AUH43_02800 [Acidobacteria bacterium 13_1_40CM_65_14]|jgi:hypothetical protein|nr:MAG: hypothetical protein AUH43_02800 [Acidobacteria bacterium 13_1_40CM_65_14]OLC81722.1 MAG: hypothetical protein AUH72_08630 [Acidobacteria bacterium 13_1_40CM_4_65_8]OLE80879.1 MAG: hypothetical protein AUF76_14045 [Acidobacteria bacterium 13_1_20CM_2_65_9]